MAMAKVMAVRHCCSLRRHYWRSPLLWTAPPLLLLCQLLLPPLQLPPLQHLRPRQSTALMAAMATVVAMVTVAAMATEEEAPVVMATWGAAAAAPPPRGPPGLYPPLTRRRSTTRLGRSGRRFSVSASAWMTFRCLPTRRPLPPPPRGRESWSTPPQRGVRRRHLRWQRLRRQRPRRRRRRRKQRPPRPPLPLAPLLLLLTAEPRRPHCRGGLAKRGRLRVDLETAVEAGIVVMAAVVDAPRQPLGSRHRVLKLWRLQLAAESARVTEAGATDELAALGGLM